MKQLLLLSNSTMPGEEYFSWPKQYVQDFLTSKKRDLIFIPFAGITISYNEYFESVSKAFSRFDCSLRSIHHIEDKKSALQKSNGIVVGGGNTFQLLTKLYEFDLVSTLYEIINEGTPYIGWSAGSNITCPTIQTTNDMPIVRPPSFRALGLVSFQINPHYTEATLPDHGGESRKMRLTEYLELNRNNKIVGLPEGDLLEITNEKIILKGLRPAKIFEYGKEPVEVFPNEDLSRLLDS